MARLGESALGYARQHGEKDEVLVDGISEALLNSLQELYSATDFIAFCQTYLERTDVTHASKVLVQTRLGEVLK